LVLSKRRERREFALAPLEGVLGDRTVKWAWMLLFVVFGIFFFILALTLELRRHNAI
jgi:hypothetical protein